MLTPELTEYIIQKKQQTGLRQDAALYQSKQRNTQVNNGKGVIGEDYWFVLSTER